MSDVFISYSRCNTDFVRCLIDQLTTRDKEPWLIGRTCLAADWLAEIYRGIEAPDSCGFK